ncbi:hybrid sensor histidine kinase/response regulator transcription factor [Gaoshiqia sediminis]|uniref:histidine kinase n=1 Tax=Gaoshiqia sediminis TaxID=2986998 RepID=A0AA42C4B8_9BACT|nr:two-component regulator propeller domain-containing protein [Gaoshiqia sediminis]MCW0481608.1 response regulator [Gaoshiqia sediminis]
MRFYSTIVLVLLVCLVSAQKRFSFEHLTVEDGLANNSVRTMFQDREGYLWFGTLNGLSRFDGQQFKTFEFRPDDTTSISSNKIREIYQDGLGYIWLMTYEDQAHRFDPATETFINFPSVLGKDVAESTIHFMYESSPGVMWLYVNGMGCARVISSAGASELTISWLNKTNVLPSDNLNFVKAARQSGVWIGTSTGMCYIPDDRLPEREFHRARNYLTDPGYSVVNIFESDSAIWIGCQMSEIFQMKDEKVNLFWKNAASASRDRRVSFIDGTRTGKVVIGTRDGLWLVDEKNNESNYLTARNSGLVNNYITLAYRDRYDDFWLVTNQRGVCRFQPETRGFTNYPLQPEIRQSILEGEKQIFKEDHNGHLWVGIYGGGISRFDRESGLFHQYLHEENNPGSLSSNLVLSIFEDRSGNLWAGTYKRGVNKIDLRQNNFHNRTGNAASTDFQGEVRAIFEDSRQWIWTGNKRGEVVVYNQQMKPLFALNDLLNGQKISTGVYAFEEDRDRNIWIGTKGDGIYVLTNLPRTGFPIPRSLETVHISNYSNTKGNLSFNAVFDLHEDRAGQMWVALYHGGVNVIRNPLTENQQILHYLENENDKFAITDNRVRCFLEDSKGNLWIGTASGLNFMAAEYRDTDNKKFRQIQRSAHPGSLSYNDIICIYEDSNQEIWVGTYGGGVNKLLPGWPERFSFEQIWQKDGLSSNLVLSMVEDKWNNLWIGTDFGLCKYDRENRLFENYYASDGLGENSFSEGPAVLTSSGLLLFGHISDMVWFDPKDIQKEERQVPIVLTNLMINGEINQEKLNEARPHLGDPEKPLVLKYNENFITFEFAALDFKRPSNIQYAFKLDDYEENWNNSGNLNRAIYRDLQPGEYLFRLKASNSDGLWVNPEMTLAITIFPPPWKTTWAYLLYLLVTVGIFFLARRFILERIRLKHEVAFEKQLADDKLKFYTSISHEFKTPLALILGPVEDLLSDKNLPPNVASPLKMVKRNTRRLLELIDQLMDFRKIQKGFFKVNRYTDDAVRFLDEIYLAFVPLAERKRISFRYTHQADSIEASLDYKSLEKIVFNLLSNAFKYTASGKTIELVLDVDEEAKHLNISVKDEGEGIREQDLPRIFERFSFGGRSHWKDESGTGVGLSLTKELVELQNGSIRVESTVGQGSCFCVTLPWLVAETDMPQSAPEEPELTYTSQYISVAEDDSDEETETHTKTSMVQKETLLVVEDNTDLRSWLSTQLGQKYRVFQAANGREGLELAKKESPDLIICDIMMPEMDGLELTGLLKNEFHTSHIPIVLLTAKSLEEHKIEGIETGADDYITKPFNMLYLQKRIENILRQRKQLKERFGRDLEAGPNDLARTSPDQEFLTKVVTLVEENLSDPDFSIDQLLEHFNFGRTVFYKKMKGISGYSPKDFVRILRMKKAGALLRENDLNISEVCFKVGYNDSDYFSKQFKRHFGKTPSDYKKEYSFDPSSVSL